MKTTLAYLNIIVVCVLSTSSMWSLLSTGQWAVLWWAGIGYYVMIYWAVDKLEDINNEREANKYANR